MAQTNGFRIAPAWIDKGGRTPEQAEWLDKQAEKDWVRQNNDSNSTNDLKPQTDLVELPLPRELSPPPETLCSKLSNVIKGSLIDTYLPLCNQNFAGHVMRTIDASNKEHRIDFKVQDVIVPYFASFESPYAWDFLAGLQKAVSHIRASDKLQYSDNQQHFIVIPICSTGGEVSLLKNIMTYINGTIKNDYIGQGRNRRRRIKIITVGMGLVASAAFVLFMAGDITYSLQDVQFLCHQPSEKLPIPNQLNPSVPNQEQHTPTAYVGLENATRRKCRLEETNQFVYQTLEHELLLRLSHKGSGLLYHIPDSKLLRADDAGQQALQGWREQWHDTHNQECKDFAIHCRDHRGPLPLFDYPNETIFEYVVNKLAANPKDQIISAEWMKKFGFCDAHQLDLHLTITESVKMVPIETDFNNTIGIQ